MSWHRHTRHVYAANDMRRHQQRYGVPGLDQVVNVGLFLFAFAFLFVALTLDAILIPFPRAQARFRRVVSPEER